LSGFNKFQDVYQGRMSGDEPLQVENLVKSVAETATSRSFRGPNDRSPGEPVEGKARFYGLAWNYRQGQECARHHAPRTKLWSRPGRPRVGPHDDSHIRPSFADSMDQKRERRRRSRGRVLVRGPGVGRQQVLAAEDVQPPLFIVRNSG